MQLHFFVLAALVQAAASTSNVAIPGTEAKVEFVGNSGQFKYCPTGACNELFVKVKMAKLEEVDQSGSKIQGLPAFASQDFTWVGPTEKNVSGVTVLEVSFQASLSFSGKNSADVPFKFTTIMTPTTIEIPYGNETVNVPSGALKFNVEISDWPFESSNNKLLFGVDTQTSGSSIPKIEEGDGSKKAKVSLGEGMFLETEDFAVDENGNQFATKVNTTIEAGESKTSIDWEFPSFTSTLIYDPVVGSEDDTDISAASAVGKSFFTTVLTLFSYYFLFSK